MHNHVTRSEINVHLRKWMSKYVPLFDKNLCIFHYLTNLMGTKFVSQ